MTAHGSLEHLQGAIGERYRLIRELGRGGMAVVYLAEDLLQGRSVALKVLRPDIAAALGTERFLREIQIASRLQHPHILGLYNSGECDGLVYYTMPYVEGESLRERLERERQLPLQDAVRIACQVAEALGYAHRHNVIHRDIKPANILLIEGQAVVADFGLAHAVTEAGGEELTRSGIAIGTPAYMSPEQASGDDRVDRRADIYALGCVTYEMLSGEPPFGGRTPQAVLARHLHEQPPVLRVVRPLLPPAVQEVVERALAKIPADRFNSADEFASALDGASHAVLPQKDVRRTRHRLMAAIGATGAFLVGLMVWNALPRSDDQLDPRRVVVFPLRDQARGGEGEAAATYIGYALEGAAPVRWLEGWQWLREAERSGARILSAREAVDIARTQRARFYIDGLIIRQRDSMTVVLGLHDALGDSLVGRSGASGPSDQGVPQLGLQAVAGLLPRLIEPGHQVDLSALTQRRPAAVAAFLQGEHDYRRANFAAASEHYRQAVKEDSLLAIAALKGAQAAHWRESNEEALELIEVALASERGLSPRYLRFARGLRSYLIGSADSAVHQFRRSLSWDPGWGEAWAALGETYYHLLPDVSSPDSLAETAFLRAQRLDSTFTPPLLHLTEMRLRRGDVEEAARLITRFQAADPDSVLRHRLEVMLRCVRLGPSKVNWRREVQVSASEVLLGARLLAVGAAQPACARAGFEAVFGAEGVAPNHAWGALLGLQGLLAAQRRLGELRRLLDSETAKQLGGPVLYLIVAAAGVGLDDPAAKVADGFGNAYLTMSAPMLWALGIWAAHRDDSTALRRISEALNAKADSSHARQDSLLSRVMQAHTVLARGDTAGALDRFSALHPTAPVGDLEWQPWEALAYERLVLAELHLARGDYARVDELTGQFDAPQPIVHLTFLPAALELQARAVSSQGRQLRAAEIRRRLATLRGTTDVP